MVSLESWELRPAEEANLFNPAFIGSLIYEFTKESQKQTPNGVPITFIPVSLAISLHRSTRERLPYSTVTSLYEWVQDNEDLLIGFHERVTGLLPYISEAIRFAIQHKGIQFGEGHFVQIDEEKIHFPASFLRDTTPEVNEVIKQTRFIARWFLKSGSESSILACWGVKP